MSDVIPGPWSVFELKRPDGHIQLMIAQDTGSEEDIAICTMTGGHMAMRATAEMICEVVNKATKQVEKKTLTLLEDSDDLSLQQNQEEETPTPGST